MRRLQFSLISMAIIVAVCSAVCACVAVIYSEWKLRAFLERRGAIVDVNGAGLVCSVFFGEDNLGQVHVDEQILSALDEAVCIKSLSIHNGAIADEDVCLIGKLRTLEHLGLPYNYVTDEGLKYLYTLRNLESVNLENNPVTGQGVRRLQGRLPATRIEWSVDRPGLEPFEADPSAPDPFDEDSFK